MRVFRGRGPDPAADRERTGEMLALTAETEEPTLRVWRPHRQLAFGRRDTHAEGYEEAREIAIERDFPPVERNVGGRAAAYAGTTIAVAVGLPIDDVRVGIAERYDEVTTTLQRALWRLGVPAQRGEPPDAFCAGDHSLSWRGKLAGLAQHVRTGAALVGGIVIVRDREAIAEVLAEVYGALEVPFDPESVGSIAHAGGQHEPEEVQRTIEAAFVGDREARVEDIGAI